MTLHNKCLVPATPAQRKECYRAWLPKVTTSTTSSTRINENEPPRKKQKSFLQLLIDDEAVNTRSTTTTKDEVGVYIDFRVDKDKDYLNPLLFSREHQQLFPHLSQLAQHIFSIPCNSAAVEREFAAAGQVVNQRRIDLDPSSLNDILFLRSIEKSKKIDQFNVLNTFSCMCSSFLRNSFVLYN